MAKKKIKKIKKIKLVEPESVESKKKENSIKKSKPKNVILARLAAIRASKHA